MVLQNVAVIPSSSNGFARAIFVALFANPPPRHQDERLELARALFQEFHARCFWHSPKGLEIRDEHIPFVIKGLRTHGGHRGFKLAALLQQNVRERKAQQCH
jgi:hypothetical protein